MDLTTQALNGQPPGTDRSTPTASPVRRLLLTRAQVAEVTALSERTVKRLTAEQAIWGVTRIGRSVRYAAELVEQWVQAGCPRTIGPRRR